MYNSFHACIYPSKMHCFQALGMCVNSASSPGGQNTVGSPPRSDFETSEHRIRPACLDHFLYRVFHMFGDDIDTLR
jgi:hypothetical protein